MILLCNIDVQVCSTVYVLFCVFFLHGDLESESLWFLWVSCGVDDRFQFALKGRWCEFTASYPHLKRVRAHRRSVCLSSFTGHSGPHNTAAASPGWCHVRGTFTFSVLTFHSHSCTVRAASITAQTPRVEHTPSELCSCVCQCVWAGTRRLNQHARTETNVSFTLSSLMLKPRLKEKCPQIHGSCTAELARTEFHVFDKWTDIITSLFILLSFILISPPVCSNCQASFYCHRHVCHPVCLSYGGRLCTTMNFSKSYGQYLFSRKWAGCSSGRKVKEKTLRQRWCRLCHLVLGDESQSYE